MIAPDSAAELRAERRFDLVAAVLIGVIAMLAAVMAIIQIYASQATTRANLEAARLAADLSARIAVSGEVADSALLAQQYALMLRIDGAARGIAGVENNDAASVAVGQAEEAAGADLSGTLTATTNSSGGQPLDPYTAGLIDAGTAQLQTELIEQNHQVDLANTASSQARLAVLGLSLLALAGVLTGLAAVLRESRGGWIALGAACAISAASGIFGLLAVTGVAVI